MNRVVTAAIVFAFLAGCGPKLKHGEVIGKRYEPEHTFVMFIPMTISTGKTSTLVMIPYVVHDDEDFILTVHGADEDLELRTEDWYVTESVYEETHIGDFVGFDEQIASRTDKHEKIKRADS